MVEYTRFELPPNTLAVPMFADLGIPGEARHVLMRSEEGTIIALGGRTLVQLARMLERYASEIDQIEAQLEEEDHSYVTNVDEGCQW